MTKPIIHKDLLPILDLLKKDLFDHFGSEIEQIFLYGSYARGDHREDSDVDVMILLRKNPTVVDENFVNDLSFDYMYHYEFFFSIMLQSKELFNRVIDFYPLFASIGREGVLL